MKVFSLFSGIGGFDLAAKRLGHEIVGACEIDKYARSVYSKHFPDVSVWEDATKINPEDLPDFEMLCAGFPCQAFSLAGRRLGFEDTRGTLFYEIARIAKEKRPRIIFLENVKGLLYHDEGRTLTTIIQTFYELGYDIEWQVINGKYFLPQNRDRIFIVGHLRGKSQSKIFPLTEINRQDEGLAAKESEKRKSIQNRHCGTITATYWKGWGGSRPMIAVPKIKSLGSMPFPFMKRKTEPKQKEIAEYLHTYKKTTLRDLAEKTKIIKTTLEHYFRTDSSGALPDRKDWMILKKVMGFDDGFDKKMTEYVEDYKTHEMQTRVHDSSGLAPTLTGGQKLIALPVLCVNRNNRRQNGRRFKTDGEPSFTLTTQDRHGVYDGKNLRMLTPLECERLQGFPDEWTNSLSDTQRYKCLGNAVMVPKVQHIMAQLTLEAND